MTPEVPASNTLRYRNVSVNGAIQGVGEQYFRVRAIKLAQGKFFDATSVTRRAQEVVIDDGTRKALFGSHTDPIGQVVFLGSMPARVIGVTQKKDTVFGSNDTLNVWIPYTTALSRVLGNSTSKSITVRVNDASPPAAAEQAIVRLLTRRHVVKDFFVFNTDAIRKTIERTTATMTLLVSMIALIALVVGGIGVMNIMLVSVTERTREIGVRMAVGARQSDIRQQFLIEAVLVCLLGGAIGICPLPGAGRARVQGHGRFVQDDLLHGGGGGGVHLLDADRSAFRLFAGAQRGAPGSRRGTGPGMRTMKAVSLICKPAALALLLALAGCGGLLRTDYEPPATSAPKPGPMARPGTPSTPLAEGGAWWRNFNDPVLTGLVEGAGAQQRPGRGRHPGAPRPVPGGPVRRPAVPATGRQRQRYPHAHPERQSHHHPEQRGRADGQLRS